MHGVFPDVGLGDVIAAWAAGAAPLRCHLAQNNVTITRASVLSDFTEANYSGYASQLLGTPGTPVYDPTNHWWTITFPNLTYQNTTGVVGNNVYAVYFTDAAGTLIYAEEVSGGPGVPVDMGSAGKTYVYTPIIQSSSQYTTSP